MHGAMLFRTAAPVSSPSGRDGAVGYQVSDTTVLAIESVAASRNHIKSQD